MHEQVRKTAEAALEAIEGGMCVVIGLQSTGEANTSASREEQGDVLDDFVSGGCLIRAAANCSGHPIAMPASGYSPRALLFLCDSASADRQPPEGEHTSPKQARQREQRPLLASAAPPLSGSPSA